MTVLLVRHARAGRRQDWRGDDRLRPLSPKGHGQARELVDLAMGLVRPSRSLTVLSSPWVRCVQTVEPLAKHLGTTVEPRAELGEGMGDKAVDLVMGLVANTAVLCTHGDVVGDVLVHLHNEGIDLGPKPTWPKASVWVLQTRAGRFTSAKYVPPPS